MDQFLGWAEYYDREPWGFTADDMRFGTLTAMVAQAAGAKVQPKDFMLSTCLEKVDMKPGEDDPKSEIERMKAKLGIANATTSSASGSIINL